MLTRGVPYGSLQMRSAEVGLGATTCLADHKGVRMADTKRTTRSAILYTLSDPRTGEVRYLGWTARTKRLRFKDHIHDARRGRKDYRSRWIASLLRAGVKPTMRTVVILQASDAPALEIGYISILRARGVRLTNTTDGGEGVLGWVPSAETRAAISRANKGRPPSAACRAASSAVHKGVVPWKAIAASVKANKGKRRSSEFCAAVSRGLTGRIFSAEHRAAMSRCRIGIPQPAATAAAALVNKGRPLSAEHRAKIARAKTGLPATEAHRASLRAAWVKRRQQKKPEAA
jgi:hypothetical protein